MPEQTDDTSQFFRASLERRLAMARQEEARIASTITALQQQLKAVKQRREAATKLFQLEFGTAPPAPEQDDVAEPREVPLETIQEGPLTGLPWASAILRILERAGEPLHVKEIWRRLADGGFSTTSRDPLRSIVAIVLRTDGIVRAEPNTYGLAEHVGAGAPRR